MNKTQTHAGLNRHQARESAIEILYAWQSGGYESSAIDTNLEDRLCQDERQRQDAEYLREAVYYIARHRETIDPVISELAQRSLRSIAMLELNILRLAFWELTQRMEIPYRIIINEALELARDYSGEAARAFVNGVLDRMAARYRKEEFDAQRKNAEKA